MINFPYNGISMSTTVPTQNVPVQTSQNNFQSFQHPQTATQQMQTSPYVICTGNPQDLYKQGPFYQPHHPDMFPTTHQHISNVLPTRNPCQPIFQTPFNLQPAAHSQQNYSSLPQNILDQIRSCVSNAAPIFILPGGCNQSTNHQQPSMVSTANQGCIPQSMGQSTGFNYAPPIYCPPSFYPYPIPLPVYEPFGNQIRSKERPQNCEGCRSGCSSECKNNLLSHRYDCEPEEHLCTVTNDGTICSKRNCPSSLSLQALASQFLSLPGIISCAATRLILRKIPGSNIFNTVEDTMDKARKAISVLTKDQLLVESRNAQQVNGLINLHMTTNLPANIIPILTFLQLKVNLLKAQVESLINKKVMESQGYSVEVETTGAIDPAILALKTDAELRQLLTALQQKECDERINVNFAPYHSQRVIAEARLRNIQAKIRQVEDDFDRRKCIALPSPTITSRVIQQFSESYCSYGFQRPSFLDGRPDHENSRVSPDPFSINPRNPRRLFLKPHVGSPETTYDRSKATSTSENVRSMCSNTDHESNVECVKEKRATERRCSAENCTCCQESTSEESLDEDKKKLRPKIDPTEKATTTNGVALRDASLMRLAPNVATAAFDTGEIIAKKESSRAGAVADQILRSSVIPGLVGSSLKADEIPESDNAEIKSEADSGVTGNLHLGKIKPDERADIENVDTVRQIVEQNGVKSTDSKNMEPRVKEQNDINNDNSMEAHLIPTKLERDDEEKSRETTAFVNGGHTGKEKDEIVDDNEEKIQLMSTSQIKVERQSLEYIQQTEDRLGNDISREIYPESMKHPKIEPKDVEDMQTTPVETRTDSKERATTYTTLKEFKIEPVDDRKSSLEQKYPKTEAEDVENIQTTPAETQTDAKERATTYITLKEFKIEPRDDSKLSLKQKSPKTEPKDVDNIQTTPVATQADAKERATTYITLKEFKIEPRDDSKLSMKQKYPKTEPDVDMTPAETKREAKERPTTYTTFKEFKIEPRDDSKLSLKQKSPKTEPKDVENIQTTPVATQADAKERATTYITLKEFKIEPRDDSKLSMKQKYPKTEPDVDMTPAETKREAKERPTTYTTFKEFKIQPRDDNEPSVKQEPTSESSAKAQESEHQAVASMVVTKKVPSSETYKTTIQFTPTKKRGVNKQQIGAAIERNSSEKSNDEINPRDGESVRKEKQNKNDRVVLIMHNIKYDRPFGGFREEFGMVDSPFNRTQDECRKDYIDDSSRSRNGKDTFRAHYACRDYETITKEVKREARKVNTSQNARTGSTVRIAENILDRGEIESSARKFVYDRSTSYHCDMDKQNSIVSAIYSMIGNRLAPLSSLVGNVPPLRTVLPSLCSTVLSSNNSESNVSRSDIFANNDSKETSRSMSPREITESFEETRKLSCKKEQRKRVTLLPSNINTRNGKKNIPDKRSVRFSVNEQWCKLREVRHSIIMNKENKNFVLIRGSINNQRRELSRIGLKRPYQIRRSLLIRSRLKDPENCSYEYLCPFTLLKRPGKSRMLTSPVRKNSGYDEGHSRELKASKKFWSLPDAPEKRGHCAEAVASIITCSESNKTSNNMEKLSAAQNIDKRGNNERLK